MALLVVDDSIFASVALPVALALIMGSLGLALTTADFRRVLEAPRRVAIGLGNLLVVRRFWPSPWPSYTA